MRLARNVARVGRGEVLTGLWWGRPKREEIPGERRRIHNEELYVMYTSTNITIRVMK